LIFQLLFAVRVQLQRSLRLIRPVTAVIMNAISRPPDSTPLARCPLPGRHITHT